MIWVVAASLLLREAEQEAADDGHGASPSLGSQCVCKRRPASVKDESQKDAAGLSALLFGHQKQPSRSDAADCCSRRRGVAPADSRGGDDRSAPLPTRRHDQSVGSSSAIPVRAFSRRGSYARRAGTQKLASGFVLVGGSGSHEHADRQLRRARSIGLGDVIRAKETARLERLERCLVTWAGLCFSICERTG